MTNAVLEGLKETLRNVIMAIVPVLLSGINIQTGEIAINHAVILAVALYTALMGVDKWLHVKSKDQMSIDDGKSHGLVKI